MYYTHNPKKKGKYDYWLPKHHTRLTMSTQTSFVARQYRLREWAAQIQECKNRPFDMTVVQWCQEHDIIPANYYYRQSEVRKALLQSQDSKEMESSTCVLSFVGISGKVAAVSDPAVNSANPFCFSAIQRYLHCSL